MHDISNFKILAKQLSKVLPSLSGQPLPYQDALELVATLAGVKNWKTLSALQVPSPVNLLREVPVTEKPNQSTILGEGSLYSVLLTVDVTMSGVIYARGATKEDAIEAAQQFAADHSNSSLFELDEGNYRGPCDYYCGDSSTVELVADTSAIVSPNH